jgi:diguanylate cyclase (GGDEF)-like protein
MILLALLVLLTPVFLGGALLGVYLVAPGWLIRPLAVALLSFYGILLLTLLFFLLAAVRLRRRVSSWPLMENFLIGAYLVMIFAETWLTGTHFTIGLLFLFLGASITSILADIHKLRLAYFISCGVLAAFAVMELSGIFRYAPLFTRPPYRPDGSPLPAWFALQVSMAIFLVAILYISIIASKRWGIRESIYREMSAVDGLTRLTNRRTFIERSERELSSIQQTPSANISCIMIDIDHFKSINDNYGHPAGDAVLVKIAAILQENARQYDEVGRYGGEEFAVLLPSTPLAGAVKVAERQRARIADAKIIVDDKTIRVTASFGVAAYPSESIRNIDELLKAADAALYEAKQAGRNRVIAAAGETAEPEPGPGPGHDSA